MQNSVQKFNALNGRTVSKNDLEALSTQAFDEQQFEVMTRLHNLLEKHPDAEHFVLKVKHQVAFDNTAHGGPEKPTIDNFNPESLGIPYLSTTQETTLIGTAPKGLGKAVSSNDIYEMVTKQIISSIEQNNDLIWYSGRDQEGNKDKSIFLPMPINFGNKKHYRGINTLLLSMYSTKMEKNGKFVRETKMIDDDRLFWLTFKQIEDAGGTLKKGAISMTAVYYNWIFKNGNKTITEAEYYKLRATYKCGTKDSNAEKCSDLLKIPFLKYYNVFNERDVEGIDFAAAREKLKQEASVVPIDNEVEKIEAAEAIINNMPKKPIIVERHIGKGQSPNYKPLTDIVEMPQKEQYSNVAVWYGTAFHELTHATGHESRIGRIAITKFDSFGSPQYAFEELIAELGSAFLNSESGILFHTLKKNSAYIKGWQKSVVDMLKEDNKAIFKAAGAAQKAADYILDRNAKGVPAYLKDFVKQEKSKITAKKEPKAKPDAAKKGKVTSKIVGYGLLDNISGELVASKKSLPELEKVYHDLIKTKGFENLKPIVHEIILKNGKNTVGAKVSVNWSAPKKKLTKKELEAANPEPEAVKPKSVSLATAIDDILKLQKYKGIGKIQANLLYKHFKDRVDNMKFDGYGVSLAYVELNSPFEIGNLSKLSDYYVELDEIIWLTPKGQELILSIKNRLESLQNQKHNYALFDGLHGYVPKNINLDDTLEFSKKNLEGKSIYHQDIGKTIKFTKPGIKKSIHGKGKITRTRLQLIYIAKDLLKKSRLFKIENDNQKRSNVGKIYKLRTLAILDGQQFEVFITVQEKGNGVIYYDHTGIKLKRQFNVPGDVSAPLNRVKLPLKDSKDTKKTTTKKNNPKQLGTILIDVTKPTPPAVAISEGMVSAAPLDFTKSVQQSAENVQQLTKNVQQSVKLSKNSYIKNVGHTKTIAENATYFDLQGAFIDFTGQLEQKTEDSLVITLDAPPGSGKTRTLFQFLNIAANSGLPSVFASLEEHPSSKIFHEKRALYIASKNEHYIDTIGELPPTYDEFFKLIKPYPIIAIDSWNKVFETYKGIDFDRSLRKALNGKIIMCIFQRTGTGQMRGGSKAGFDGDIILEVVPGTNYKTSYVIARKNRYQTIPLNEIGYNFYEQKTINPEQQNAFPAEMTI